MFAGVLRHKCIYVYRCDKIVHPTHSSVTTTEIYAKFNLRRLEMDFPSLVKSNYSRENRKMGHGLMGHKPSANPLNASLIGS